MYKDVIWLSGYIEIELMGPEPIRMIPHVYAGYLGQSGKGHWNSIVCHCDNPKCIGYRATDVPFNGHFEKEENHA